MIVQGRVQLSAPDVDRKHDTRAIGQQYFREAAGRCADVEADVILDIDRILFERACQLDAAARDIRVGRLSLQGGVSSDRFGGFQDRLVVGGDEPGLDRGAGAGAALEQSALYQQDIDAFARRGHFPTHWT